MGLKCVDMKLSTIAVTLASVVSLTPAFAGNAATPSSLTTLVNSPATVQKFLARGNCHYHNARDRGPGNTFSVSPGSPTLIVGAADRHLGRDESFWDGGPTIVGAAIDANAQAHSEGYGSVVLMENGEGFYWYQDSSVQTILEGFNQGKVEVETFILDRCDS
jgi:hypothetical protein